MRRYKMVACILLISSVFCFALAAPIAVRKVCEACNDAVDGGDNMIIGLGKRAVEGDSSVPSVHPQAMSSPGWFWNVWAPSSQSSSAPNYGSGTRPKPPVSSEGTVNLIPPETSTEIQNRPLRPLPTIQVGGRLETVPEEEAPEAVAQQISKPKPTGMFKGIFGKIFGKISKLKFWR